MTTGQRKRVTAEEFWAGMAELKEQMKKTDRQIQETALQMKDTDRRMKETDRQFKEADRRMQEKIKAADRRLDKLDTRFSSQWGKLIESLMEGDLIRVLNQRGIEVHFTAPRFKGTFNDTRYEFDIIASNSNEVVIVEVKTTLKPSDVDEFINKIMDYKKIFPARSQDKVYGAIAYLRADAHSDTYAEKQGLFVIRASGHTKITNKKSFKPKLFG